MLVEQSIQAYLECRIKSQMVYRDQTQLYLKKERHCAWDLRFRISARGWKWGKQNTKTATLKWIRKAINQKSQTT